MARKKVSRKRSTRKAAPKRKRTIAAVAKKRTTRKPNKMKKMQDRAVDALLTGAGQLAGQRISPMIAGTLPNPWLRAGVMAAAGLMLGGIKGMAALGNGIAANAVAEVGNQFLPGAGSPALAASLQPKVLTGTAALSSKEKRMIEAAARSMPTMNGKAQSEVLTGLYDTSAALV
jgi:hypothetical protein